MKKLSIIAIILSSIAIGGQIFIFATQKENEDETYKKALQSDYRVYTPVLPDSLTLCGERVPLETYYVREALDRELTSAMYLQSSMLLYMKRAGRYFPIIEPILKQYNMPSDLKYLCVIESGLTNATSPAKAQGFWQFMKATASSYGLEVNDDVDMRNNVELSTIAACKLLKSNYDKFGSWAAACAAYNCGPGGLSGRMSSQGVKSYYDTRLNAETTRYVYRILAYKIIMQHPQDYGFYIRKCDLYPPMKVETATLSGQNVDIVSFAKSHGTNYKAFRDLNPWILNDKLANKANKTYTVKIPVKDGLLYKTLRKDHNTSLVDRL